MSGVPLERSQREDGAGVAVTADDVILFGPFRLHVAQRLVEQAGVELPLGGRALDILIVLIEQAGKVVSKHDLMARVWPDVTVDEGSLRVHVAVASQGAGRRRGRRQICDRR